MGKGGQEIKNVDTIQTLEKERGEKVNYAPDFMWVTSEDDMQEPHVKRYYQLLLLLYCCYCYLLVLFVWCMG